MKASRWRRAGFVVALCAAWLILLAWAAGIDPRQPPFPAREHSLPGSRFHAAFGKAVPDGQRLRVEAQADDGSTLQATTVPDLEAADFPILHYRFAGISRTVEVSFVFRTRDAPADVQAISLPAPGEGDRAVDLSRVPGWKGTIVEVGFAQYPVAQLVPSDTAFRPFELVGARLASDSWRGRLAALRSSWFAHSPWQFISASALGPSEAGDSAPHAPRPPLVAALAIGTIGVLAYLLLGLRGRSLARVMLVATALGWLSLDAAWLRELVYRRAVDGDIWGSVPFSQRQEYVADARTLQVAYRLRILLAHEPASTRVLVNAESPHDVLRLIYLAAPLNIGSLGGYVGGPSKVTIPVGTILVNYGVEWPRALGGVMRIGSSRLRVKVIDRNEDVVVYRVEAVRG